MTSRTVSVLRFAIQGHHGGGATTVGLGEVKFYAEAP